MAKKKIKSFYDFVISYPHKDSGRRALAAELKKLSGKCPQLKEINSLTDLMLAASLLSDPQAIEAASGDLWSEFCAIAGRPVS